MGKTSPAGGLVPAPPSMMPPPACKVNRLVSRLARRFARCFCRRRDRLTSSLSLWGEWQLAPALRIATIVDAFQYEASRDLTGYEDGTENPQGEDAVVAAVLQGASAGLDGSSFVAVQQWLHDLDRFERMPQAEQDATFGRRREDNEEMDDAPPSAHVKRTAQESFDPEAFVVRRSMPWADGARAGLVFVAFGRSLDAFEAQMRRMAGEEDGIVDALFRFTHPLTGAYFWCPPVGPAGKLDLRALGL